MRGKLLIVNLKAYREGVSENAYKFCEYAYSLSKKFKSVEILVGVNPLDIKSCLDKYSEVVISQNVDEVNYGAKTGHIPLMYLVDLGVKGSIINHSEFKLNHSKIRDIVWEANKLNFKTFVCVDSIEELKELIKLGVKPEAYAIEPPELIGTGKSVSKYKPETVIEAVDICRKHNINILCGAGISNSEDVSSAVKLGVNGVLVASAIVKSINPREVMEDMVKALISAPAGI